MPTLTLTDGRKIRYCVMIPSKDRADILAHRLKTMPHLVHRDVYVGYQTDQLADYQRLVFDRYPAICPVTFENPKGSVAWARQQIKEAVTERRYQYYVTMDDNTYATKESLENLVRCCAEYPEPTVMAGLHRVLLHFDRARIAKGITTINGLRSYASVSMMMVCVPAELWEPYTYPHDAYGLDDRHWYLWMLDRGYRNFRVCMDSPFRKPRYQRGGQGDLDARAVKCGHAIRQLATDFPAMVGSNGTLRIPWDFILERMAGATSHRLAMGTTLRTDQMTAPKKRLTIKKKGLRT